MVLARLAGGMVIGAGAALTWILSGGSLLLGLGIYSAVATAITLAAAVIGFWLSERRESKASQSAKRLHPAE